VRLTVPVAASDSVPDQGRRDGRRLAEIRPLLAFLGVGLFKRKARRIGAEGKAAAGQAAFLRGEIRGGDRRLDVLEFLEVAAAIGFDPCGPRLAAAMNQSGARPRDGTAERKSVPHVPIA
jgi:hypothetical protein